MSKDSRVPPATVAALIDLFGGNAAFARACGFRENPSSRGGDIRQRNFVPVYYWPAVIAEARRLDLPVTVKTLLEIHAGDRVVDAIGELLGMEPPGPLRALEGLSPLEREGLIEEAIEALEVALDSCRKALTPVRKSRRQTATEAA